MRAGRMVVQKGPDLLLEAVPFIQKFRGDAKFVFVGDGHMMDSLKGRAAHLGVSHSGKRSCLSWEAQFIQSVSSLS